MKWIQERDALIAQTLAFVQSVTGRKDEPRRREGAPPAPAAAIEVTTVVTVARVPDIQVPDIPVLDAREPVQTPPPPQPLAAAAPRTSGEFRSEIQARVANFRKYQQRFEREREEYCAATLARARAAIRDGIEGPTAGK